MTWMRRDVLRADASSLGPCTCTVCFLSGYLPLSRSVCLPNRPRACSAMHVPTSSDRRLEFPKFPCGLSLRFPSAARNECHRRRLAASWVPRDSTGGHVFSCFYSYLIYSRGKKNQRNNESRTGEEGSYDCVKNRVGVYPRLRPF